jgi:hypothetical protein
MTDTATSDDADADARLDRAIIAITRTPAPSAARDRAISAALATTQPRLVVRLRLVRLALAASLLLAATLLLLPHLAPQHRRPSALSPSAKQGGAANAPYTISADMEPSFPPSAEKAVLTLRSLAAAAAPVLIANGPADPVRLGQTLPAAARADRLHIWDYSRSATSRVVPDFEFPGDLPAALSPDGATLVFADGTILTLATGQRDKIDLGGATYQIGPATYTRIGDLQFSPDASRLALLVTLRDPADQTTREVVQIRSFPAGRVVCEFLPAEPYALRLAFSPDGKQIATADRDRRPVLRDAATGQVVQQLDPPLPAQILSIAFSPDGRYLAAAARDDAAALFVWDATTRNLLWRPDPTRLPRPVPGGFALLRFSPDNQHLAAAGPDGVTVFTAATGQPLAHLRTSHARHLHWTADGQSLTAVTSPAVTDDRPRRQVYPEAHRWSWRTAARIETPDAQP